MARTTIVDAENFRIEAEMYISGVLHVSWEWKDGREEWQEVVTLVDDQIDALVEFINANREAVAA
ncbi:MAG: hypothetical protein LC798_13705 [Chloroflexi bacterium]|nr:hypothetical protein [Chloroflexota bacterium]